MIFISALINVLAWLVIGYAIGRYFAKYSRCGKLCSETAGSFGALIGGLLTFIAYGLPTTLLWANNVLFAIVGAFGLVYIALPEKERAIKVERAIKGLRRLSRLDIDFAGMKR